ncbi:MAG: MotA/TolQ/ExbB proton channel family protein [Clostridiales bacterium]|nr:MotA/TolQ/ExbB proton channel family protein [Clostridiales bacterium]
MYVRGILILLAAVLFSWFAFSEGHLGQMAELIDLPSYVPMLLTTVAVINFSGGFKLFIKAINALISKKYYISVADREKSIRLFKLLGKSIAGMGVLNTVLGAIFTLFNLSDLSQTGPLIGVALISLLYALFANLAFIGPAIHLLESRYNTEAEKVISDRQIIDKLLELCYRQGVTPEEILEADEIHFYKGQQYVGDEK